MYDFQIIASEWHGGQWSDMYKYASSGYIEDIDVLIGEVAKCLLMLDKFPEDEREHLEDGLQTFLHALNEREDLRFYAETGWLMAPWCESYSDGNKAIIPERFVQIAADSIDELRESDVYRVLDQFETYAEARQMAIWIIEQREDLEPAVDEAMELLRDSYA
jgi:hypothetical protein